MLLAIEKLQEFERLMTAQELAQLMGVSEDTIVRYWQRNIIPQSCGRKFGAMIRFDPKSISDWLMNGELPRGYQRHPAFNDLVEVTGTEEE